MNEEIKNELARIRGLFEERKAKLSAYDEKRFELTCKFNDDDITEEELEKIEDEIDNLERYEKPDCYFTEGGYEYFEIPTYNFLPLSKLLEKYLDMDELNILFNEAQFLGYIQHDGEDYFDTFGMFEDGDVYRAKKYQEITKRMVAYWYCEKNNILPQLNYSDCESIIAYNLHSLYVKQLRDEIID